MAWKTTSAALNRGSSSIVSRMSSECVAQSLELVGVRRPAASRAMTPSSAARTTLRSSRIPSVASLATSADSTVASTMFHESAWSDLGAASLRDRHEPLLLDALDRLADDRAAHAELLAEHGFGRQRCSRAARSPRTMASTRPATTVTPRRGVLARAAIVGYTESPSAVTLASMDMATAYRPLLITPMIFPLQS